MNMGNFFYYLLKFFFVFLFILSMLIFCSKSIKSTKEIKIKEPPPIIERNKYYIEDDYKSPFETFYSNLGNGEKQYGCFSTGD